MRKSIRKMVAVAAAGLMVLSSFAVVPNTASAASTKAAKKIGKQKFDEAGTYHAYVNFQCTESWVYRNPWYSDDGTGLKSKIWNQLNGALGSEEAYAIEGTTVTDAELKGNGTYTIKIEGINGQAASPQAPDGSTPANEPTFSILSISTDIPKDAKDKVQFSDVHVTVDDVDKGAPAEITWREDDLNDPGILNAVLVDSYHEETPRLTGMMVPNDSVVITFTVSGFNYDNPDATGETESDASSDTNSDTSSATSDSSSATSSASSNASAEDSSSFPIWPVAAGVAVVVVIVVVVVVTRKKK